MLLFLCSGAAVVLACGATPAPYLTVVQILGGESGQVLPRDAAVLFELATWPTQDDSESSGVPTVTVRDHATGEPIAGTFERWHPAGDGAYVWRPLDVLAPDTTFEIEVVTTDNPRVEIDAPTSMSAQFDTTDALTPAIDFTGELRASLRVGTAEYTRCAVTNNCGGGTGCEVLSRPALYADVELPVPSGGDDAHDYYAVLVTSDRPMEFAGPTEGESPENALYVSTTYQVLRADEAQTLTVEVHAEGQPYTPCFSLNAWDGAGHWRSASPLCLAAVDVEAMLGSAQVGAGNEDLSDDGVADGGADHDAQLPNVADEGSSAENADEDRGENASGDPSSASCSALRPGGSSGDLGIAWCGVLMSIAAARRRRRVARAPCNVSRRTPAVECEDVVATPRASDRARASATIGGTWLPATNKG